MILPGAWLGILGGGQLGRMFTHAAQRMGFHVAVFDASPSCPAGQAADRVLGCDPNIPVQTQIADFARLCQAVTLEFENVDAELLEHASQWTCPRPGAHFLSVCQNRIKEKSSLRDAGFPTTPFESVDSKEAIVATAERLGWPLVLKTATSGYDGKGQAVVRNVSELDTIWDQMSSTSIIAEQMIDFQAEVSMLVARNASGEIVTYPLLENAHANHILDVSICPASQPLLELETDARAICAGIANRFDVVGLFCVEFFVDRQQGLLINEIAPRPHNSGHLTIEAFNCSQFEQQVRAVANLPLSEPVLRKPAAMANLLGDLWGQRTPAWEKALRHPDASLHLYGKEAARDGRKMGHLTVLADDSASASEIAIRLRDQLG